MKEQTVWTDAPIRDYTFSGVMLYQYFEARQSRDPSKTVTTYKAPVEGTLPALENAPEKAVYAFVHIRHVWRALEMLKLSRPERSVLRRAKHLIRDYDDLDETTVKRLVRVDSKILSALKEFGNIYDILFGGDPYYVQLSNPA